MAKQQTFAGLAWQNKGKKTRRERFLSEMEAIIPWRQLLELIEPHYPKAGNGRPPLGLEKMLRIYFLARRIAKKRTFVVANVVANPNNFIHHQRVNH